MSTNQVQEVVFTAADTLWAATTGGAAFESDGAPWIATCGGYRASGAGLVTREDGAWRHVDPREGLASANVRAVAIGPQGTIAAGTDRGLSVYREGKWQILRDGPTLNKITTVAVTPDGAAWFGFGTTSSRPVGGGISRFDGQAWETFSQAKGLPISDAVRFLEVAPDSTLWAAGGCGVAYRTDTGWQQAAGCDELQGNVAGMAFAPDGAVWIAASFNVYRIDEEGGRSWQDLLPTSIAATEDGTVLIGQSLLGEGGVWAFDGSSWQPVAGSPRCVAKMVVDGKGTVWGINCEGHGLTRQAGGAWEEVTAEDGLPPGRVADIVTGPTGGVWVAAEGGIGHLRPEGWVVRERSWEGTVHSIAVAPDGSIWLATSQGAVHILFP
jgi:ligand-binding sensor domain-containing protein